MKPRIIRRWKRRWARARKRPAFLKILLRISMPFFMSRIWWKAWGMLGALLGLMALVTVVNVQLSYVGRDFMTALSKKQGAEFYLQLRYYLIGFCIATIVGVLYRYTEERLALLWREWMTQRLLKRYFFSRNYYKLRNRQDIDNPDQRIAEDVRNFTATSLSLLLIILNSFVTAVAFVAVLAKITTTLVVALVAYAVVGTVLTVLVGNRLVRLHYRQYNREANLRTGLIRLRDNAESIAFFRGEARERIDLLRRFQDIYRNTRKLISWNRNLAFLTNGYNYFAIILPTVIVAPLFLDSKIEFGVITQSGEAFAKVLAAASVIISQFERVSAYLAGVSRLAGLWDAVNGDSEEEEDDRANVTIEEGKSLAVKELTVVPPKSNRVLVKDLDFSLVAGEGLLITGESGVGKSSVLRTIAGLWNSGSGVISRPPLNEMMFLPQRPYMPVGTLRAQMIYPARESDEHDKLLEQILKKLRLGKILERGAGGLDRQVEWANVLSLGEQQRVSFARLLFRKPKLAFLDEATSALDEENEKLMYELLEEMEIAYVSVGHRSELKKYHAHQLHLAASGKWEVSDIAAP